MASVYMTTPIVNSSVASLRSSSGNEACSSRR